jgi:hypothetical protein
MRVTFVSVRCGAARMGTAGAAGSVRRTAQEGDSAGKPSERGIFRALGGGPILMMAQMMRRPSWRISMRAILAGVASGIGGFAHVGRAGSDHRVLRGIVDLDVGMASAAKAVERYALTRPVTSEPRVARRVEWWRRRELHPGPKIHPRRHLHA